MTPGVDSESATTDTEQNEALLLEVSAGLRARPKRLPEKLLYDELGSKLFEEITKLEAYYPTRTEIGILRGCLPEVRSLVGPAARVIEFGTGAGTKTSMLLDILEEPAVCMPIDIAEAQLLASADRLRVRHPEMRILPLAMDYTRPFALPEPDSGEPMGRRLFFFPGSTIGNLEPDEAERFLARIAAAGGTGANLLVGVDLVKPVDVLRRAYDDPEGVTAEFNLNALRHLNRVFDGTFALPLFGHRAIWNAQCSRIEMHLVSKTAQEATLRSDAAAMVPLHVSLGEGEAIVTEHSYKFELEGFTALCRCAGWRVARCWTDPKEWFAVYLLERATDSPRD